MVSTDWAIFLFPVILRVLLGKSGLPRCSHSWENQCSLELPKNWMHFLARENAVPGKPAPDTHILWLTCWQGICKHVHTCAHILCVHMCCVCTCTVCAHACVHHCASVWLMSEWDWPSGCCFYFVSGIAPSLTMCALQRAPHFCCSPIPHALAGVQNIGCSNCRTENHLQLVVLGEKNEEVKKWIEDGLQALPCMVISPFFLTLRWLCRVKITCIISEA